MESQPPVPPQYPTAEPPPAAPDGPQGPPPPPPPAAAPLPWEQPGAPMLESLLATLRLLLLRPREAYQAMAVSGSYARPVLFALIVGVISIWVSATYELALGSQTSRFWSEFGGAEAPDIPRVAIYLLSVVGAPFLVAIGVGLGALIYQLFLLVYGGPSAGLGVTFRVVCYAVAANVWMFVPVVGGLVGSVWGLVIAILGLATVHRVSVGKATAVVLSPAVLCCLCCLPFSIWRLLSHM